MATIDTRALMEGMWEAAKPNLKGAPVFDKALSLKATPTDVMAALETAMKVGWMEGFIQAMGGIDPDRPITRE